MKSEKETIYDYAAELKLLAFKENWNAPFHWQLKKTGTICSS